MALFARRLSRDALIYSAGLGVVFPLGIVGAAVTTRYIGPADYGRAGLLLTYAAFLSVLYNLGSAQGTFMWVFGSFGGKRVELDARDDDQIASGMREALGSGLMLTVAIAFVGAAVFTSLAPQVARLFGGVLTSQEVRWAAFSASAGAIWRFVVQPFRGQRKPAIFGLMNTVRPLAVLGVTVWLLAKGEGVTAIVAGTTVGTLCACILALTLTWRNYRLRLRPSHVREIYSRGARFVPVVLSLWVAHNTDIFFVAHYAPLKSVGLYRLASRVAALPSYFVSAFLLAWSPLDHLSLSQAVILERGRPRFAEVLFLWFACANVGLLLCLGLGADAIVQVAAHSYKAAAPLIPLLAAGMAAYGIFYVIVRISRAPRKQTWFALYSAGSAVLFVVGALVLGRLLGAYGVALAQIGAMLAAAGAMSLNARRGSLPLRFPWCRAAAATAIGLACYVGGRFNGTTGWWHVIVAATVAILIYPVALMVLGVVPRAQVKMVRDVLHLPLRTRRGRALQLLAAAPRLPPSARSALVGLFGSRLTVEQLATSLGTTQPVVRTRVTRALRALAGIGRATPRDQDIGRYLLSNRPNMERDAIARQLWNDGVDPWELDRLDATRVLLSSLRPSDWDTLLT